MAFAYRCIVLHYSGSSSETSSSAQPFKRTKELNLASPTRRKFKKEKSIISLCLSHPSNHTTVAAMLCIFLISTFSSSKQSPTINQSLSLINPLNIRNILPSTSPLPLPPLFCCPFFLTSIFCFRFAKNAFRMSVVLDETPLPLPTYSASRLWIATRLNCNFKRLRYILKILPPKLCTSERAFRCGTVTRWARDCAREKERETEDRGRKKEKEEEEGGLDFLRTSELLPTTLPIPRR